MLKFTHNQRGCGGGCGGGGVKRPKPSGNGGVKKPKPTIGW